MTHSMATYCGEIASLGPSYRQGNFVVSHDIAAISVLPCESPLRSLYILLFLACAPSRVSSQPYKKTNSDRRCDPGVCLYARETRSRKPIGTQRCPCSWTPWCFPSKLRVLLSHPRVPSLVEKMKRLPSLGFCVVLCRDVIKTNASSDLVFRPLPENPSHVSCLTPFSSLLLPKTPNSIIGKCKQSIAAGRTNQTRIRAWYPALDPGVPRPLSQ